MCWFLFSVLDAWGNLSAQDPSGEPEVLWLFIPVSCCVTVRVPAPGLALGTRSVVTAQRWGRIPEFYSPNPGFWKHSFIQNEFCLLALGSHHKLAFWAGYYLGKGATSIPKQLLIQLLPTVNSFLCNSKIYHIIYFLCNSPCSCWLIFFFSEQVSPLSKFHHTFSPTRRLIAPCKLNSDFIPSVKLISLSWGG